MWDMRPSWKVPRRDIGRVASSGGTLLGGAGGVNAHRAGPALREDDLQVLPTRPRPATKECDRRVGIPALRAGHRLLRDAQTLRQLLLRLSRPFPCKP